MYENNTGAFFKGLIFGVAAGAVAALLLAPQSGEKTREDLKKLAQEFGEKGYRLLPPSKERNKQKTTRTKSCRRKNR